MKRILLAAAIFSILNFQFPISHAQNDGETYEQWKKRMQNDFAGYKRQQKEEYENFRQKANADYAAFLKKNWDQLHAQPAVEQPDPKPVPPVVAPKEETLRPRKDKMQPVKALVTLDAPKPQPAPVEPVELNLPLDEATQIALTTSFFGSTVECRVDSMPQFDLPDLGGDALADAWDQLSDGQCDVLLAQCLDLRRRLHLGDWGYIELLDSISQVAAPKDADKATFLMAWLYCQSGYMMRLAVSYGRLYMLYASDNVIYEVNYITIGGYKFYPYKGEMLEKIKVCPASFPNEQTMTLRLASEPVLEAAKTAKDGRRMQADRYPEMDVTATVNPNLIDFYNNYPTGSLDADFGSRWTIYANTPLSDNVRETLYPQLERFLTGKTKLQAVEMLLNWVQTSLVYEYDDTVWGGDRAFFAEETLHYPYADCEDRSILFSLLVRDLVGLRVVLLYYPGHLATAVRFEDEQPSGDYLQLNDGRYYIADPTYIGATVGMSMPSVKDETIKVIILD